MEGIIIDVSDSCQGADREIIDVHLYSGADNPVTITGVPTKPGNCAISSVKIVVTNADGVEAEIQCLKSTEGYVAIVPATHLEGYGTIDKGLRVMATGVYGGASQTICLGIAELTIESTAAFARPGTGSDISEILAMGETVAEAKRMAQESLTAVQTLSETKADEFAPYALEPIESDFSITFEPLDGMANYHEVGIYLGPKGGYWLHDGSYDSSDALSDPTFVLHPTVNGVQMFLCGVRTTSRLAFSHLVSNGDGPSHYGVVKKTVKLIDEEANAALEYKEVGEIKAGARIYIDVFGDLNDDKIAKIEVDLAINLDTSCVTFYDYPEDQYKILFAGSLPQYLYKSAKSLCVEIPESTSDKARKFTLSIDSDATEERDVAWSGGEIVEKFDGASKLAVGRTTWLVEEIAPNVLLVDRVPGASKVSITGDNGNAYTLGVDGDGVLEVKRDE